jgi:hypothetical protein
MNHMPNDNAQTVDDLKGQFVCYRCVGEKYLSAEIIRAGSKQSCSYCDGFAEAYSIGEMAERIAAVFEEHYVRTSDQPEAWEYSLMSDRELDYDWERKGEPVIWAIASAAEVSEKMASDIRDVLDDENSDFDKDSLGEETEFSSESHYEQKNASDGTWREEWDAFESSLKTDARFFSRKAQTLLASVFNGMEKMSSTDDRPVIITIGPGAPIYDLYRARAFQSENKLVEALCYPDRHLGSPPPMQARGGRMNAHGISVFYGANAPNVAIAEVRPPVGSWVATARFEIIRALRLLDLTALTAVREDGSLFDAGFGRRLERTVFFRTLSNRMTRPIMPDDESFDYLATQAIADFLATENDPPLDRIKFPSVQAANGALNFVLFHKAASVEPVEFPPGTTVRGSSGHFSEEGWETDYSVTEEVTSPKAPAREKPMGWPPSFAEIAAKSQFSNEPEIREMYFLGGTPTLRIDLESVSVHLVQGVEFATEEHSVRRRRWENPTPRKTDF